MSSPPASNNGVPPSSLQTRSTVVSPSPDTAASPDASRSSTPIRMFRPPLQSANPDLMAAEARASATGVLPKILIPASLAGRASTSVSAATSTVTSARTSPITSTTTSPMSTSPTAASSVGKSPFSMRGGPPPPGVRPPAPVPNAAGVNGGTNGIKNTTISSTTALASQSPIPPVSPPPNTAISPIASPLASPNVRPSVAVVQPPSIQATTNNSAPQEQHTPPPSTPIIVPSSRSASVETRVRAPAVEGTVTSGPEPVTPPLTPAPPTERMSAASVTTHSLPNAFSPSVGVTIGLHKPKTSLGGTPIPLKAPPRLSTMGLPSPKNATGATTGFSNVSNINTATSTSTQPISSSGILLGSIPESAGNSSSSSTPSASTLLREKQSKFATMPKNMHVSTPSNSNMTAGGTSPPLPNSAFTPSPLPAPLHGVARSDSMPVSNNNSNSPTSSATRNNAPITPTNTPASPNTPQKPAPTRPAPPGRSPPPPMPTRAPSRSVNSSPGPGPQPTTPGTAGSTGSGLSPLTPLSSRLSSTSVSTPTGSGANTNTTTTAPPSTSTTSSTSTASVPSPLSPIRSLPAHNLTSQPYNPQASQSLLSRPSVFDRDRAPSATTTPATPPIQYKSCHTCKGHITELEYISAIGKYFHTQHFTCSLCYRQLGNGLFQSVGGGEFIICALCTPQLRSCFICLQSILPSSLTPTQKMVGIDSETFAHFSCFQCADCQVSLVGIPMQTDRIGRAFYCQQHARAQTATGKMPPPSGNGDKPSPRGTGGGSATSPPTSISPKSPLKSTSPSPSSVSSPHSHSHSHSHSSSSSTSLTPSLYTCVACGESIHDRVLLALDNPWHPSCFQCAQCYESLEGQKFLLHQESNNVYCLRDYQALFAPRCFDCGLTLIGKGYSLDNAPHAKFHEGCMKCRTCQRVLKSGEFLQDPDEPTDLYCEEHYEKLFRTTVCDLCQKTISNKKGSHGGSDGPLHVSGKSIHQSCFFCCDPDCMRDLSNYPYELCKDDQRFYCREHLPGWKERQLKAEKEKKERSSTVASSASAASSPPPHQSITPLKPKIITPEVVHHALPTPVKLKPVGGINASAAPAAAAAASMSSSSGPSASTKRESVVGIPPAPVVPSVRGSIVSESMPLDPMPVTFDSIPISPSASPVVTPSASPVSSGARVVASSSHTHNLHHTSKGTGASFSSSSSSHHGHHLPVSPPLHPAASPILSSTPGTPTAGRSPSLSPVATSALSPRSALKATAIAVLSQGGSGSAGIPNDLPSLALPPTRQTARTTITTKSRVSFASSSPDIPETLPIDYSENSTSASASGAGVSDPTAQVDVEVEVSETSREVPDRAESESPPLPVVRASFAAANLNPSTTRKQAPMTELDTITDDPDADADAPPLPAYPEELSGERDSLSMSSSPLLGSTTAPGHGSAHHSSTSEQRSSSSDEKGGMSLTSGNKQSGLSVQAGSPTSPSAILFDYNATATTRAEASPSPSTTTAPSLQYGTDAPPSLQQDTEYDLMAPSSGASSPRLTIHKKGGIGGGGLLTAAAAAENVKVGQQKRKSVRFAGADSEDDDDDKPRSPRSGTKSSLSPKSKSPSSIPIESSINLQARGQILPSDLTGFISNGILQTLANNIEAARTVTNNQRTTNLPPIIRPSEVSKKNLHQCMYEGISYQFMEYAPRVFEQVRHHYGISQESYLQSLVREGINGGLQGDGKSGMLFYKSNDDRYILKTLKPEETKFFIKWLGKYIQHVCITNQQTLLPRFFGMYKIRYQIKSIGGEEYTYRLIVMNNLFDTTGSPGVSVRDSFDLKGSTRNRRIPTDKIKPGRVLLDLNFNEMNMKLHLGQQQKSLLMEQICKDCAFLKSCNIMDHSLLVGIHYDDDEIEEDLSAVPLDAHNLAEHLRFDDYHPNDAGSLMSIWQASHGGVRGFNSTSDRPRKEIYFMGIIDILQEFNTKKALESAYKTILFNKSAVSAIESRGYNDRFVAYLHSIIE